MVGGAASTLAADAAVGAVAEPGNRTARVGDFGRGFVNEGGDVGPGFFPGFGASFDAGTGAFGGADDWLGLSAVVFLVALGISFFDCSEAGIFGDICVESGCFVGVAVSLGAMGAGSGEVLGLLLDFSSVEDAGVADDFFPTLERRGAIFVLDCCPGFCAGASFSLPLVIGVLGLLACCPEDCIGSAAAVFSSCSNGDPFNIDPNGDDSPCRAAPSETTFASFGSDDSMTAVSSSAAELGLSGFVVEVTPFSISRLL